MKQAEKNAVDVKRNTTSLFKPEYMQQVDDLCRKGATDRDIAIFFDVSYGTVVDWKKQHPEFFLAILRGKRIADGEVSDSLFKSANGYDYYEEVAVKLKDITYGSDGKTSSTTERVEVVRVKRHKPAEVVAQIFWLKNRRPELWRDAKQIDAGPELLKATQQGANLLAELASRGFVELEGEYEIVGADDVKKEST